LHLASVSWQRLDASKTRSRPRPESVLLGCKQEAAELPDATSSGTRPYRGLIATSNSRENYTVDILFLHVPKTNNYYRPINKFSFILFPPIGLLGLADYIRKNGYRSLIIHLAVEREVEGRVDLERILGAYKPAIVGLDLHWHFQSFDVIEVARRIKQLDPTISILLGGFTASLFAHEILRDFDCIDYVIRGDAETPLLQLISHHGSDRTYSGIPNLAFRDGGEIRLNPMTFIADSALLDSVCYTDFTLMKDYQCFVSCFSRYVSVSGLSQSSQRKLFGGRKSYQVYLGRGCPHGCSYCGGSQAAHKIISGRHNVSMRSVDAILASIRDLARFGFDSVCLALDSFSLGELDDHYAAIFERVREMGLSLDVEVERYSLPSLRFLRSFRGLPGKGSFITISPHTNSEKLRRQNGLYRYSNRELEQSLEMMEKEGINILLCFTCGLPFETMQDLRSMWLYQRQIRKRYKHVRFKTCMIEIEPGSDMSRNPDKYGIRLHRSSFADYYAYHRQPFHNHWFEMGYERPGFPEHREVSRYFCRHFCERFGAGWASPIICAAVGIMWKVGAFALLDRVIAHAPNVSCSAEN
jgi:radical SAM superfamily enzyme YgiQ (UPF0313 family)